jgi:hypothetical protein
MGGPPSEIEAVEETVGNDLLPGGKMHQPITLGSWCGARNGEVQR